MAILTDEYNNQMSIDKDIIVLPTELTLPPTWKIPDHKKLSGWAKGDFIFKPGVALTGKRLQNGEVRAVYIDCYYLTIIDEANNKTYTTKHSKGYLIKAGGESFFLNEDTTIKI